VPAMPAAGGLDWILLESREGPISLIDEDQETPSPWVACRCG